MNKCEPNDRMQYRIVHVLTRLLRAGAEENTVATCQYQIDSGHEVYLIHGNEFDPEYARELNPAIKRIKIDELVHPIQPVNDYKGLQALKREYRKIRPDVVHTHQSKAGALGRLAVADESCATIHTVHIAHFLSVGWLREKLYVALEKYCSRRTHKIIDVSGGVMQACLDRGIGKPDQHQVIHSGMDIEKFKSAREPENWQRYITNWPAPDKPFVVLMLAAFEPRKRHEPFLESIAPVLRRNIRLCAVFCGQGDRLDAAKRLSHRLGIADQVRFVGFVSDPERYIALADLCVLTSEREGLPRVFVQYVAGGKTIVANHLPGIEDIVQHGYNGVVLPGDEINGVATEIERLVNDSGALQKMNKNAASASVSSWDVCQMGEKIQAVYEGALHIRSESLTSTP
ncbi:MAG: glycosyltransferase [Granulosicoccus sp.]